MRRVLKIVAILLVVLVVGIQAIRPARTNPAIDESQTIVAKTQMTPEVASILDRSCRDCHTNKTMWPWYTNVAPVSWWLSNHVNDGRRSLNMSEWGKLDMFSDRSEEHTSELQSRRDLVCRLLLEKKNRKNIINDYQNI